MRSVLRRPVICAGILALTIAAAAACGSSSSGVSPGGGSSSAPAASSPAAAASSPAAAPAGSNPAAVALVPASIKSKGSITVAADATYAPDEFLASNGTTVVGMDADLAKAIGKQLGLSVNLKNVTFDAIIPGLVDGRYDLGMSSFTDTKAREKQVNFVTYFQAGTSFFEKAQGGPPVTNLASLCGLKVAVEAGTTEETDAKGQAKKCPSGKTLQVLSFNTQSEANSALAAGRADVGMADSPVAGYQVAKSQGNFKLVGTSYGTAPYGIAIPKAATTMDQAVLVAVKALMADGTYATILKHWGLQAGSISNPVINGAIS
jgi:polar amino acid transport system substrate-binding protein